MNIFGRSVPDEEFLLRPNEYVAYRFDLTEEQELTVYLRSNEFVNLHVMDDENYERFEENEEFEGVDAEDVRASSRTFQAPEAGEYYVVIENNGDEDAVVRMRFRVRATY